MLSTNSHTCKDSDFTVSHSPFLSHLSLKSLTSAWGCFARSSCYGDSVTVTTVVASQSGTTLVGAEMCYDRQRSPRLLLECTTMQKDENSHPQASVATPLLDLNETILLCTHAHKHTLEV